MAFIKLQQYELDKEFLILNQKAKAKKSKVRKCLTKLIDLVYLALGQWK